VDLTAPRPEEEEGVVVLVIGRRSAASSGRIRAASSSTGRCSTRGSTAASTNHMSSAAAALPSAPPSAPLHLVKWPASPTLGCSKPRGQSPAPRRPWMVKDERLQGVGKCASREVSMVASHLPATAKGGKSATRIDRTEASDRARLLSTAGREASTAPGKKPVAHGNLTTEVPLRVLIANSPTPYAVAAA
jgi:hypothetical protein